MKNESVLKLLKSSTRSFIINLVIFLGVRYFFGQEIAVLVGIATVVATLDEFGYFFVEQQEVKDAK